MSMSTSFQTFNFSDMVIVVVYVTRGGITLQEESRAGKSEFAVTSKARDLPSTCTLYPKNKTVQTISYHK